MGKYLLLGMLLVVGCVSVKYDTGKEKITYRRFGNQKVEDLEFSKDQNKIKVKVKSTETKEIEAIKDAINNNVSLPNLNVLE